jgi:hypothetical protein
MMGERYDRAKLEEFSKQIFQDNPHLDRVYVTEDGNFFGERSRSDATNYARTTQQELIEIERLKHNSISSKVAESDDPMTRDVASLMLALNCTEDKARELIQQHKGNAAAAVQTVTATINAVQQADSTAPAPAKAPKATRKPSTTKKTTNGTT